AEGGVVGPRALGVRLLITRSKRVACSTGTSAGFARPDSTPAGEAVKGWACTPLARRSGRSPRPMSLAAPLHRRLAVNEVRRRLGPSTDGRAQGHAFRIRADH